MNKNYLLHFRMKSFYFKYPIKMFSYLEMDYINT